MSARKSAALTPCHRVSLKRGLADSTIEVSLLPSTIRSGSIPNRRFCHDQLQGAPAFDPRSCGCRKVPRRFARLLPQQRGTVCWTLHTDRLSSRFEGEFRGGRNV